MSKIAYDHLYTSLHKVSAPSFSSYLPVLISSSNRHYTSHCCIAFHLLGMCEFHLWLGVLKSFILSPIVVLPKIKGMSGVVPAVLTCAALITQFSCEEPQLSCAVLCEVLRTCCGSCISTLT